MVADQFPMFKLATLLARQMSSPIASRLKKTISASQPLLVCSQFYHTLRRVFLPTQMTILEYILPKKQYAVSHPRFGAQVCSRVALMYQRAEWATRRFALRMAGVRLPRDAYPPPLPKRAAQDLGSDLLGEIIIFTLGALIIIFEVNRQADIKEAQKLEKRSQWLAVKLSLKELQQELSLQQKEIDQLLVVLEGLLQDEPPDSPQSSEPPYTKSSNHSSR